MRREYPGGAAARLWPSPWSCSAPRRRPGTTRWCRPRRRGSTVLFGSGGLALAWRGRDDLVDRLGLGGLRRAAADRARPCAPSCSTGRPGARLAALLALGPIFLVWAAPGARQRQGAGRPRLADRRRGGRRRWRAPRSGTWRRPIGSRRAGSPWRSARRWRRGGSAISRSARSRCWSRSVAVLRSLWMASSLSATVIREPARRAGLRRRSAGCDDGSDRLRRAGAAAGRDPLRAAAAAAAARGAACLWSPGCSRWPRSISGSSRRSASPDRRISSPAA